MDLHNKRVIITGASGGIGTEIARKLGGAGAKLVITGRNRDRLDATAAALDGVEVRTVIADVTQAADCEHVVATAVEAFGGVDVLVNNAGYGPPATLLNTDEALWDVTLDTCLKGVYLMTQAAVRVMLPNGGGRIVQISSTAGQHGYPNRTAYCAAKWGVQGFTAALRAELSGQGIRAHTISPGPVATAWWETANNAQSESVMAKMVQPEQVAEAVHYVLTQPDAIQIDDMLIKPNEHPWG
jgi:NADP-dependent 3-hydroxy acid dehydrogenase YdfG